MERSTKIFVAGHAGMVGRAVVRTLTAHGHDNLLLKRRDEVDLFDQSSVLAMFKKERPDCVVMCAARVGGIAANMRYPAEFLYENLQIQNNVIWAAFQSGVEKLLFLGSSCIYPRDSLQPMKEEYLLTGALEPTNEAYALAKIAGMKLCERIHEEHGRCFISCMPANVYGEFDNFERESAHVIPALLRRLHEAREQGLPHVTIWGSGNSRREFLHVRDLAESIYWLMSNYTGRQFLNVGTGSDISIKELSSAIREVVGYTGELVFDVSKPDGMPRKLLDVGRLNRLGWKSSIVLREGLTQTYEWWLKNRSLEA